MSKFAVILAAAGRSERFGNQFNKKVFTLLANRPLWMYSAEAFSKRDDVGQIILVISPEDRELFADKFAANAAMLGIQVVAGGKERADSVLNGLNAVRADLPFVAIHDAARPCVATPWVDDVFRAAKETGAAILATQVHATVKTCERAVDYHRGLYRARIVVSADTTSISYTICYAKPTRRIPRPAGLLMKPLSSSTRGIR